MLVEVAHVPLSGTIHVVGRTGAEWATIPSFINPSGSSRSQSPSLLIAIRVRRACQSSAQRGLKLCLWRLPRPWNHGMALVWKIKEQALAQPIVFAHRGHFTP